MSDAPSSAVSRASSTVAAGVAASRAAAAAACICCRSSSPPRTSSASTRSCRRRRETFNASLGIVFAGICGALDGRVARPSKTTSKFGLEYDSLADIVSFGRRRRSSPHAGHLEGFGAPAS
jgi:phosphatidylglycerophosphate synthase